MSLSASDVLSGCTFYPIDANSGAPEANLRAAINRAYYSTYHAVLPVVATLPQVKAAAISGVIGHREAYRRLQQWKHVDADTRKNLGYQARVASMALIKLIEVRERADYDLACTITMTDYNMQLSRMSDVSAFLHRYEQSLAA